MSDRHPAQSTYPSLNTNLPSARAKKRTRQRSNQQKRARVHDTYIAFTQESTYGNAFRAWLAWAEDRHTPQELRSANKFARALRALSSASTGEPDYPETERITADTLVQWVEDLAWTLNAKFTTKANPARLKTPTSRIGPNFSSLINFLMYARVFSQDDFVYLLDTLASLTEDLERAARVNRIMEAYTEYLLDAYFGAGRTVDESYWGEYEVENIKGSRELVLRKFDPKGDPETSSLGFRSFTTRFPAPLVDVVKPGDTMTLQICHLDQVGLWVPYMYSGFTPTRDDGGTRTPTERRQRNPEGRSPDQMYDDSITISQLQASLSNLEVSTTRESSDGDEVHDESYRGAPDQSIHAARINPDSTAEFSFDESRFTEEYYRSWEGDIDTDEDVTATVQGQHDDLDFEGDLEEYRGYPTNPTSSSSSNSAQSPRCGMDTNTNLYYHTLRGHLC